MGSKQGNRPFDPRPHLRRLENGAEYLDVKWRLAWMRSEYPDAQIETELMKDDEDGALFKAVVRLPDGGSAMGHAGAPRGGAGGHIERAETQAVGRALAALGYGAEYTADDSTPTSPAPSPAPPTLTPTPPTPLRSTRERAIEEERPAEWTPEPEPQRRAEAPRRIDHPRPLQRQAESAPESEAPATPHRPDAGSNAASESVPATPPAPDAPSTATPAAATPADTEDVSWNKFWIWAKRRGYRDANHLRELLGPDVMQHTPQEVRNMLRKHELDNPPPGTPEE